MTRTRKSGVVFLALLLAVSFAASAFGAVGNAHLENNLRIFPNLVVGGRTMPVVPMHENDWINEEVWVESPLDSDEDGKRDLLCFHYTRPIATRESSVAGVLMRVPLLITASPYTGNDVQGAGDPYNYQFMEPKVDGPYPGENNADTRHYTYNDVQDTRKIYSDIVAANFNPSWLPAQRVTWVEERDGSSRGATVPPNGPGFRNYFRSRGYASGVLYILGNARAEGLLPYGGYDENLAAASVTDWLNGRVKAYRYPYPVRYATEAELANNPKLDAENPNLQQNVEGKHILDGKYIRDDLNGGYVEVKAYWATGDTMMAGQSYEGAMPVQAMLTGVEGLKVIVPFAPTTGAYEYYRANGTVYAPGGFNGEDIPEIIPYCFGRWYNSETGRQPTAITNPVKMGNNNPAILDVYFRKLEEAKVWNERNSGSYNKQWDERNGAKYAKDAKGAIIIFHGFNDLNVKFKHAAVLYEAAKKEGVTIKGVFHLMKHASPYTQKGFNFYPRIHGVLDNLLYGIPNTALQDWPEVIIHNNETLAYEEHAKWPINDNVQKFYLTPDRLGKLSINQPSAVTALDFTDVKALTLPRPVEYNQMANADYMSWKHTIIGGTDTPVTSGDPFSITANEDRLMYTADIKQDTRISGYIKMTANVASDKKVGVISAMLVDLGNANYVHSTYTNSGRMAPVTPIDTVENFPAGTGGSGAWEANSTNLTLLGKNPQIEPWNIIARGSVSVQKPNYTGKTWIDFPETNYVPEYYYQTTAIEPGKFYPYTWELNVMDYTIKAGHKLGLILFGTDPEYTQRPLANPTKLSVEIGPGTYLSLPLVGDFATDEVPVEPTRPSSGGGGCNAAYPLIAFAALAIFPFLARKKG